jgi:hypothetical protein
MANHLEGSCAFVIFNVNLSKQSHQCPKNMLMLHGYRNYFIIYNPPQVQKISQQPLCKEESWALLYEVKIMNREDQRSTSELNLDNARAS